MPERAAIDNDFLNHLLGIKTEPDLVNLIKRFFRALQVSVFMHPLVFDHEASIINNKTRNELLADNTITVMPLENIWENTPGGREYYSMMVKGIYRDFTGKDYPCEDMFGQWLAMQSLGEVHTVVACAFVLCECFLSDDRGAADLLQGIVLRRLNRPINIYNRQNRCDYLRTLDISEREGLNSNELKKLAHSR